MKVRKGFTLVELLVVIAILAILATASIIGFTAFTKRAQVSNDSDLVAQLNTYVLAASTNRDFKTVTEIRDELKKSGFELADLKLAAEKQDYYIGFDIKQDKFVLLKDGQGAEGYTVAEDDKVNVFVFVSTEAAAAEYGSDGQGHGYGYSLYLQNGEWSTLNVSKGVDVGENTGITSINYTNSTAQEVTIRTNSASTTLTVEAPNDIVHHYGSAGSVNIIKIASNSYHENGSVAFLEVANGRVALESKSEVTQIHLNATEGNFNDITIAKSAEVEMPAFSRDPVEIPSEGKLVVALQEGTTNADADKDYVWLTAIGIYEQVTVSDSKTSAGTEYAATSTSVNAEKKETAQQIANNITFTSDSVDYKVTATTADNGVTWTYEVKTEAGETAAEYSAESSGSTVTVTNVSTSAAVETTKENGLTEAKKNEVKEEVVEVAKNVEELQKAEESGYEITHHEALAPTCTEDGHTAYDSYYVNNEEQKVGYKVIPATGLHTKPENPAYYHNFDGQWQHAVQCVVCNGWIVEYCVDANNDNACDQCGQQMYIEVYTIGDLVNSEDDIVAGYYILKNDIALTKMTYIKSVATIDLNGYTLSNYPLNSPADAQFRSYTGNDATMILNLKDSSSNKTGKFISRFGNTFYDGANSNKVNPKFIINCEDGVTINTCYDYQGIEMNSFSGGMTYFLNNVSKNVEINNAHLIIGAIAMVNTGYTVTFKNCTIESRNSSGMLQGGSGNIVYDGCTITTVMQSSSGNVLDSSDPNVTFINGTTVNGVTK